MAAGQSSRPGRRPLSRTAQAFGNLIGTHEQLDPVPKSDLQDHVGPIRFENLAISQGTCCIDTHGLFDFNLQSERLKRCTRDAANIAPHLGSRVIATRHSEFQRCCRSMIHGCVVFRQ